VRRTARMFDDHATPRSPFVVAYSPRSRPDTLTDFFLSSTLQLEALIFKVRRTRFNEERRRGEVGETNCVDV
jgi:hypothetical protein